MWSLCSRIILGELSVVVLRCGIIFVYLFLFIENLLCLGHQKGTLATMSHVIIAIIMVFSFYKWDLEVWRSVISPKIWSTKFLLEKKGLKSFSLSSKSSSISMKTPVTTWQMELSPPQDLHSWHILLCIILCVLLKTLGGDWLEGDVDLWIQNRNSLQGQNLHMQWERTAVVMTLRNCSLCVREQVLPMFWWWNLYTNPTMEGLLISMLCRKRN